MDEPINIFDILRNASGKYPDKVFMQIKEDESYIKYTYNKMLKFRGKLIRIVNYNSTK